MGRPPCCDKLVGVKKGPWTPEEDIVLVSYIQKNGPGNWRVVPTNTGLMRCSKSCRLRWTNYLRPGIKRGGFTDQEEKLIVHLQALLGNRWAAIASYLPERTDNDIKNYWNTHLKKQLQKMDQSSGISSNYQVPAVSRGQWEKRLQTDINTAKQALQEALSIDPKPASSVYASSTENISRLLEGWISKPPGDAGKANSDSTQNSSVIESGNYIGVSPGTFDSVTIGFDSEVSESTERKPDLEAMMPLTMIESWLLDDNMEGGSEGLLEMSLDMQY